VASPSITGRTSINVPRDFPSIQAAVNGAAPGATIHVGPGTCTGTGLDGVVPNS